MRSRLWKAMPWLLAGMLAWAGASRGAAAQEGPEGATSLERPAWQVGDSWIVETLTTRIQGMQPGAPPPGPRVRWQFRVAKLEKLAGRDCYRVDIECLAESRVRPRASLWCDQDTLFLRQFQTQVAFGGQYHMIQESFDCPKGEVSPVLASVNALPIALPAFLPRGAKAATEFRYVSQPLPAGSKDPGIVRFTHAIEQRVKTPNAKTLEQATVAHAKALPAGPTAEVDLTSGERSQTQLWRPGLPWPLYTVSGPTQAWLVSHSQP